MGNSDIALFETFRLVNDLSIYQRASQKLLLKFAQYSTPHLEESILILKGYISIIPELSQEQIASNSELMQFFKPTLKEQYQKLCEQETQFATNDFFQLTLDFYSTFMQAIELLDAAEEHHMLKAGQKKLYQRHFERIQDQL